MEPEKVQEQYILQQHKGRVQAALDAQKGAIEFTKMALRGATVLNGSAAVAIIYSKMVAWYSLAVWFAAGACGAVVATGLTYVTQYLLFETWRAALMGGTISIIPPTTGGVSPEGGSRGVPTGEYRFQIDESSPRRLDRAAAVCRGLSILFVLASYILFGIGLYEAYSFLIAQK